MRCLFSRSARRPLLWLCAALDLHLPRWLLLLCEWELKEGSKTKDGPQICHWGKELPLGSSSLFLADSSPGSSLCLWSARMGLISFTPVTILLACELTPPGSRLYCRECLTFLGHFAAEPWPVDTSCPFLTSFAHPLPWRDCRGEMCLQ